MFALLALFFCALIAGAMDAVTGAGGLVQIPALFIFLSAASAPEALATHKFAASIGTLAAVFQYAKHTRLPWRLLIPTLSPALVGAYLGSRVVTLIDGERFRPVLLICLIAVASLTFWRKNLGRVPTAKFSTTQQRWLSLGMGLLLGFYDGFIGLGAGTLFLITFVWIFGMDFLLAAAAARVVNLATNLAACLTFAYADKILYATAMPLALCNVVGAVAGVKLATVMGPQFVRVAFLVTAVLVTVAFAFRTWAN